MLPHTQTDVKTSGTEDPEMNSCSYTHLIFDKGTQNIQRRKNSLKNVAGKTGYTYMLKTETTSMSFTLYKYQLKVDEDLDIKPETLKLVQERLGNTLELTGIGNDFLNRTQTAQQLREKIDRWDYMKLKKAPAQQKKWPPD
jgi:hypothetical protein